jgi:parallel beta-helix repeat protein
MFSPLTIQQGQRTIVDRVKIYDTGMKYWNDGETGDDYSTGGLFMYNSSYSTISNVIVKDVFSTGICIESTLPSLVQYRQEQAVISNCIVDNATIGLYFEDCDNVVASNCIIQNCDTVKVSAFSLAMAVNGKVATTSNITLIGLRIIDCANGILSDSDNLTIIGCDFRGITRYAMELKGEDITVSDNTIYKPTSMGIYVNGVDRGTITGNKIYGGAGWGYAIRVSNAHYTTFSGNVITQSALHYPDYGISEASSSTYTFIDNDNIINVANSQVVIAGDYSYWLRVNTTARTLGITNKTGTTWLS